MRLLCKYMCRSPNPLPLLACEWLQLESEQLALCQIVYSVRHDLHGISIIWSTGENGNSGSQAQ